MQMSKYKKYKKKDLASPTSTFGLQNFDCFFLAEGTTKESYHTLRATTYSLASKKINHPARYNLR
jgi:hypothetical protein